MPDIILEGDHPRIISVKFGSDWLSSFRGEEFVLQPCVDALRRLRSIFSLGTGHSRQRSAILKPAKLGRRPSISAKVPNE
jgi:hypothetical protein